MDWRNEESDHSSVENFVWDEKNLVTKARSDVSLLGAIGCNVCSQGVQANFGTCKESRSFTSVFERLELEAEIDSRNERETRRKTNDAQTEPLEDVEQELIGVKQRDILSCQAVIQNADILNFQGRRYLPEDIARHWKKDSRMWLWKSARLMRTSKCESQNITSTINHDKENQ